MPYISLVLSLSILVGLAHTCASVCTMVTLNRTILRDGKILLGYQFYRMHYVPDVLQCARYCFFRRRCLSFNYNAKKTSCELSNAQLDSPYTALVEDHNSVYSEIADWGEAIGFGPCSKRPCRICEACYPAESSYTCVKEELTSCRDVKICTQTSSNGHYLLRPVMGTSAFVNIYCHLMNTNYPKDYVTLHKENYCKYPPINSRTCSTVDWNQGTPGVIYYWKIRLDIMNLHVVTNDRSFTNVSCDPSHFGISDPLSFKNTNKKCMVDIDYGIAADCMGVSCHPRRGKFHINLEGTGFIVAPSVKWEASGYRPTISSFNRSPTNEVITAICGGNCGYCSPKQYIILEPKP